MSAILQLFNKLSQSIKGYLSLSQAISGYLWLSWAISGYHRVISIKYQVSLCNLKQERENYCYLKLFGSSPFFLGRAEKLALINYGVGQKNFAISSATKDLIFINLKLKLITD